MAESKQTKLCFSTKNPNADCGYCEEKKECLAEFKRKIEERERRLWL
jgi:hypothetical protein